jgi:hypothetical protein
MTDEVTEEWRKLHNEEFNDLYSPTIEQVIKSRRVRWAQYVAHTKDGRVVCRVLVGKPKRKMSLGRHRRRWENNIKVDLHEVGCGGMVWINP